MTIASALCQGIDNFVECSVAVRIAFFLIPVAVVLQAFGVGTAAWSNSDSSRQGLWTYCYDEREFSCCESIYDKTGETPVWLISTQVFQCISCCMGLITLVMFVLLTCVTKTMQKSKVSYTTIVFCTMTDRPSSRIYPNETRQAPVQPSAPPLPVIPPTSATNQNLSTDQNECIICMERPKQTIFLDCGHIACCDICSNTLMSSERKCPTCRTFIRESRRYYNA
ncbi:uncharacterized protein LOC134706731 isoform X2 [Mytilus trossulus]|uniref:uncharacterized protein LOC134706731 isoform X2 n=1 Tax=Mytilus trossulus TaxID=6551 RepID=UPI0030050486